MYKNFASDLASGTKGLMRRVIVAFLFTLLVISISIYLSWKSFVQLHENATIVELTHNQLSKYEELLATIINAESSEMGYAFTGDTAFLLHLVAAEDSVYNQLQNIRSLVKDDPLKLERVKVLETLIAENFTALDSIVALQKTGNISSGSYKIYAKGETIISRIKQVIKEANMDETALMNLKNQKGRIAITQYRVTIILFLLIVIATIITSLITIISEFRKRALLEDLLRSVLNASLNGIQSFESIRDLSGKIIDFRFIQANATSYQMGSGVENSYIGKTLREVSPAIALEGLFMQYVTVVETGIPLNTEHYFNSDGVNGWFRIVAVKLGDGFTVTFDNITEAKQTKIELENNVKALKRSNEELQQFAHIASHDLQEPLRKILAFTDRVKEKNGETLSNDSLNYFDRIVNSAHRMRNLINDLLSYSRFSNTDIETEPVDLNLLLNDILSDLEMAIQKKNAEVVIGDLPVIDGIKIQLQQLFQNLISNSLKFSSTSRIPIIEIICKNHMKADLLHNGSGESNHWCNIYVKDNGIGFEQQHAEKIFQIFQRLHGRSEFEGSGIGLSICKKIVENHHGKISASGYPDEGATFTITLPVIQKQFVNN